MIEVVDLQKNYGSFMAVRGVGFSIESGEIVGLLGPNGAGKTTIMKILTGYHYASAGQVRIDGLDLHEQPLACKRQIGYLPENAPVYPELNVREYLEFIAGTRIGKGRTASGLSADEAIARAVEACSLQGVWNRGIETLSKGYRQRVGLAQAILHDPAILILDEPTSGLDPNQILEIRNLIKDLGSSKTILLSTHILQEVEAVCTRMLILNQGTIVAQGTSQEIAQQLRGDWDLELTIKGGAEAFRDALLARIPGARFQAAAQADHPGIALCGLSCPRSALESLTQLQEAVFDAAVASGAKLLGSASRNTSLETVFFSLTKGEANV